MKKLEGKKYPEQIAYLRENFGFSQAHANALVMYSRGSISSKRFATPAEYFKSIDSKQAKKIREIIRAITIKFPQLELVIAWNQPILKSGKDYVFGASVATHHILIAPWGQVLKTFTPKFEKLDGVKVNKKTIAVPNDWKVEVKLLQSMTAARLKELK
ncbi:MAG: iron chaperone, partial [Candidatus Planktophila sp.]